MILCKDVVNISELGKQTVCTSSLHFIENIWQIQNFQLSCPSLHQLYCYTFHHEVLNNTKVVNSQPKIKNVPSASTRLIQFSTRLKAKPNNDRISY